MNDFLWKIYLYRFLDAFKLIGVIFTLFFQHNGLTTFEISLLISIWSVTQLLLEVPLGVVADKYPRRNLLIIALLLLAIGYGFWLIGGFLFYALGFIFWGIKNALTSGTFESFVYDELKSYDQEKLYEKVNGNIEFAFWTGVTFSAILGGMISSVSFNLTLLLTIITTLIAAFVLLTIKSVKAVKSTGEKKYLVVLKEAVREIKTNTSLLWMLCFFCLVFATYGAADEYWALIYQNFGISISIVGFLVALGYGLFSIAGYSLRFFDSYKNSHIEYLLLVVSSILFIVAGIIKTIYILPLIFIGLFLFKVAHIKFDVKFQHSITTVERATISSLKSLVYEIVYLIFVLLFGFLSTRFGVTSILYLLGALLIIWVTLLSTLKFILKKS